MQYFAKDYRVVAIDQRGYGLSSKPPFVADYRIETLAGDVADVIEQLGSFTNILCSLHTTGCLSYVGYESCILVGHDWGGAVAWTTTML